MWLMNLHTENKDPNKTLVSKKHLSSPRTFCGNKKFHLQDILLVIYFFGKAVCIRGNST
jgi:hypothetical protein